MKKNIYPHTKREQGAKSAKVDKVSSHYGVRVYFYSNLLAWGLVLFLIGNYAFGWTTPSQNPPAGNITPSFSQWTTSGSNIYFNTGNVGIGTTAPGTRLEVGANSSANEVITVRTQGFAGLQLIGDTDNDTGEVGSAYVLFSQDNAAVQGIIGTVQTAGQDSSGSTFTNTLSNAVLLGNKYGGALQLGTNNVVGMTILSGGNVGIGTTNPGQKLSVSGNIDVMSNKIVNLTTPTAATDAATKGYVDAQQGGVCIVRWGTTSCAAGWTLDYAGYMTFPLGFWNLYFYPSSTPFCSMGPFATANSGLVKLYVSSDSGSYSAPNNVRCAVCCK
ncbi:MAG: hypothetical protein AB7D02_01755 [Candidatus Paceibacterota bacterium]